MTSDPTSESFTPPSIEEIASLLPAYEVHSFIAQGGMGAVYMASQKSLDRPVAIKVLPRHFGTDADFRRSFEEEAKSMAKLNHPNLIAVYDFGQVDGLLYIIMELVHGKSLYHSAYGKTIAPTEAARIVRDICLGLANAHKQGILHRDIKPANILLDPNANPKIGDFGLARAIEEHEKDSAYGTPGYTAPEVVHNPRAVDVSTDLYAVGIVLYELLTGGLPGRVYQPVGNQNGCSPRFDQIIRKAIHPTPAMRYRSAEDLAKALEPLTEASSAENPLLTRGNQNASPAPAKTLLTAAPASSSAPIKAQASSAAPHPAETLPKTSTKLAAKSPSAPAAGTQTTHPMPVGSNLPFIRNIIIIIALLCAIFIAWEGKKKVEANREIEKKRVAAEKLQAEKDRNAKRQERILQKQRPTKPATQTTETTPHTPDPQPVEKTESPREMLSRLQSALRSGSRSEFPKGTIKRNGRARFLIREKMTWHQSLQFAERHGAHLAILADDNELAWLCSKLDSDTTIWLGAGSNGHGQWCWIDGSPWTLEIRSSSKAACVSVDDTEILIPSLPNAQHSFYLEWLLDGSTPASLEQQFKRSAQSLTNSSPQLPAGTTSYDNRQYLLVEKSTTWQEANTLAQMAGGALASPSNPDENAWMTSFTSSLMSQDGHCWIGGIRERNASWQWSTGEPWQFAKWQAGAPDEDLSEQAGCSLTDDEQWKDFSTQTKLPYFLIEWSRDTEGHTSLTPVVRGSDQLAQRKRKCSALIRKIQADHNQQFSSNIKGFKAELRSFLRGLPKSLQTTYSPAIETLKQHCTETHIPGDISRENMPAKVVTILDSRLQRQTRIDASMVKEAELIRTKYRASLSQLADDLKSKGLTSDYRKVKDELDQTIAAGHTFIRFILE